MSDKQFAIFNHLGGADWLRKLLDKKDPFPRKYWDALLKGDQNAIRKQTTSLQEGIRSTTGAGRTSQANGTSESKAGYGC
jgi:hypothetical protein